MSPAAWLADPLWQRVALSLLHFLWQGFAVAGAVAIFEQIVRPGQARSRYGLHLTGLFVLAVCPLMTFALVDVPRETRDKAGNFRHREMVHSAVGLSVASGGNVLGASPADDSNDLRSSIQTWMLAVQPWCVAAWLAGVTVLCVRLLAGLAGVYWIARSRQPLPAEVMQTVQRLALRLHLRGRPRVIGSDRVREAWAVGFFRPLVLVPLVWITELSPDVLEAVIAHELAHIRRHDLWVNLVQRVMETLLFYHPAVWWLSAKTRISREMCCDEMAVAATGGRAAYVNALELLARRRLTPVAPLLGASMGDTKMALLNRVQYILGQPAARRWNWWPAGLVGLIVPLVLWWLTAGVGPAALGGPEEEEDGVAPPPAVQQIRNVPSEKAKTSLPEYTIEPPDVLLIDVIKLVPKAPYKIEPLDVLTIQVTGTPPDAPIRGNYTVDTEGRVDLGPGYGKIKVSGLTADEAEAAIRKKLVEVLNDPEVSASLFQSASRQPISGQRLVAPDGMVNLGTHGRVYVSGMTLAKARAAIETQLAKSLQDPKVSLDVVANNSKVYYIITEGDDGQVVAVLITGNETVLDALSQFKGLKRLWGKTIWIARPTRDGTGRDQLLPVDWTQITKGASTAANYQIFPGDRIFITEEASFPRSAAGQAKRSNVTTRAKSDDESDLMSAVKDLRKEVEALRREVKEMRVPKARGQQDDEASIQSPKANASDGPTVSPYLNLLQGDQFGISRYQTLVRPKQAPEAPARGEGSLDK